MIKATSPTVALRSHSAAKFFSSLSGILLGMRAPHQVPGHRTAMPMAWCTKLVILVGCTLLACSAAAQDVAPTIDFDKARALIQRERAGQTLSAEEQAYLARAKALRRKQQQDQQPRGDQGGGAQRPAPERLIPLADMGAQDRYEGEDGGLYGGGHNAPPAALVKAARSELAQIRPLDKSGKPSPDGRIGFVSISMSNATQEFSRFKELADRSPAKSAQVVIVDCAQGGQAMAQWVPPDGRPWQVARQRLSAAGVSPQQVQVAWVKLANMGPSGSLQDHGKRLEADTLQVLRNARKEFPNLRIAYLGSRIWAGNASSRLNPEPYAYESAFVVRWLIRRQLEGESAAALAGVPLMLWGPYLWAEGERGRKSDELIWERKDFAGDGVHPSDSGRQKVAEQLLDFVTTDPLAMPWFCRPVK